MLNEDLLLVPLLIAHLTPLVFLHYYYDQRFQPATIRDQNNYRPVFVIGDPSFLLKKNN